MSESSNNVQKSLAAKGYGYVRQKAFQEALGISKATFYRAVGKGFIVRPIKWGRASLWSMTQVEQTLKNLPGILENLNKANREAKLSGSADPVQLEFSEDCYVAVSNPFRKDGAQ